jgi:hypothetical protein
LLTVINTQWTPDGFQHGPQTYAHEAYKAHQKRGADAGTRLKYGNRTGKISYHDIDPYEAGDYSKTWEGGNTNQQTRDGKRAARPRDARGNPYQPTEESDDEEESDGVDETLANKIEARDAAEAYVPLCALSFRLK